MENNCKQSAEIFLKAIDTCQCFIAKKNADKKTDSLNESKFLLAKKQLSHLEMPVIFGWLPYLLTFLKPKTMKKTELTIPIEDDLQKLIEAKVLRINLTVSELVRDVLWNNHVIFI
ncbi:hypothetical protein [Xanthomarina sp. GH4-25]|uniref:hypothetical protein n=1 Tax=Xanthomarina sp. GH4-25 TaxID=3349335 RepID=UPI003877C016